MAILILLLALFVLWNVRNHIPVKDLVFIDPREMESISAETAAWKILDVRDEVD